MLEGAVRGVWNLRRCLTANRVTVTGVSGKAWSLTFKDGPSVVVQVPGFGSNSVQAVPWTSYSKNPAHDLRIVVDCFKTTLR
jgi:hypothetical protein